MVSITKALSLLAAAASAAALSRGDNPLLRPIPDPPHPLEINLAVKNNTKVVATVHNRADSGVKILKQGPFAPQDYPSERAHVFSGSKRAKFLGVRMGAIVGDLDDSAFTTIPATRSIVLEFDIGQTHNLSAGGTFSIVMSGQIPYARNNSDQIEGLMPFKSNKLKTEINGTLADRTRSEFILKRRDPDRRCDDKRRAMVEEAQSNCVRLARNAAIAAWNAVGDPHFLMTTYFRAPEPKGRRKITKVFEFVERACEDAKRGGNGTDFFCHDLEGVCKHGQKFGSISYVFPMTGTTVYCDEYFTEQPALARECPHGQVKPGRAAITVGEMTQHVAAALTLDLDYSHHNISHILPAEKLENNADSYMHFANAVELGCHPSAYEPPVVWLHTEE
ncbi:hypothetical protein ACJ41O_012678 [Fusarium nematophilum]